MIRELVLQLFRRTGVMRFARYCRRERITILTMHGVMEERDGQRWRPFRRYVAPTRFDECLGVLKRSYRFISLGNAVAMLSGRRPIEANCMVITFDDGYRNQLSEAWPILRRYDAPATIFVVTSHVERPAPFWFDRLDYAFQHLPSGLKRVNVRIAQCRGELPVHDRPARRASFFALLGRCKALDPCEIPFAVAHVEAQATGTLCDVAADDDWTAVMNREDVQRAAAEGVDIGSHTVGHVLLDRANDHTARRELAESKAAIEQWIGRDCMHVCYPSGRINARTASLAREVGYSCGVTTAEGVNRQGDDPLLLRRINVLANHGPTELLARASGVSTALGRFKTTVPLGRSARTTSLNLCSSHL